MIFNVMNIYRISAITLKIRDMKESCRFFSRLPGFKLTYGGEAGDTFSTFEVGQGSGMYLNLELGNNDIDPKREHGVEVSGKGKNEDFGRIIFHTESVDSLYQYMKNDEQISEAVTFEGNPADAPWGERFFHIREPNGYQLSFAQPISKDTKKFYCE